MMYPHDHDADAGHDRCERCGFDTCGEECIATYRRHERRENIAALYSLAWSALLLVRIYQVMPDTTGRREAELLARVTEHRASIRALRAKGNGQ
jgi:hypothetical protein